MNIHTPKRNLAVAVAVSVALYGTSGITYAQTADESEETEVIEVTGIRSALANALNEKRFAGNIKEIIQSEDIGKLPDNNLAEVLENIFSKIFSSECIKMYSK